MDGVGCAPVPFGVDSLLRWDGKDEFAQLRVENRPTSSDVAVQRVGFILDKHSNFAKPRIEAIAQGHVDDAVFASKGHRGFGTVLGEREEPFATATGKNHGIDINHGETMISNDRDGRNGLSTVPAVPWRASLGLSINVGTWKGLV